MTIDIQKNQSPKEKPVDPGTLGFGKIFTDHMFLMDYNESRGWHNARIVPYGPFSLDPAACSLHYGQLIFEGLKAYRAADGRVVMFRPAENIKRLNISAKRMCIPRFDEAFALKAITELIKLDAGWIPGAPDTSLYVRPFVIGTQPFLGVKPSDSYTFCVILSPSGALFTGGLTRIYVEDNAVRAVRGGTGHVKCAGNYGACLNAQVEAQAQGYAQVLWLDGIERKYVEEVGAMNIFFVIDGRVVTPELGGTILPGITRDSVLGMLRSMKIPAAERKISIREVADAYNSGKLQEVFGAGTAAVISPIGVLKWGDQVMDIGGGKIGQISQKLYDNLTGIQTCRLPDPFGWVYTVDNGQLTV